MKLIFTSLLLSLVFSCNTSQNPQPSKNENDTGTIKNSKAINESFNINTTTILKNFDSWYNYTFYNVWLSQDFIGLDSDSAIIDKATFLNKLIAGNVVAFKVRLLQGEPVYKLYPLNSSDSSITSTIRQLASIEMKNYKMEGQQLPDFSFTDLNGKHYNSASTKGKILVLKCWFIHCVACVYEFPDCNKLVDEYSNRNDVLFISLASDSQNELANFVQTKPFKYAVIPEMDNYMTAKLHIDEYPTHLLVNKNGKIIKVVNSVKELVPFLQKETAKTAE